MKSAEDTTIAEFPSDDNRRMERDERGHLRRAYLLRCWWERRAVGGEPMWRFLVEEVFGERRRRGFQSLKALVAFIQGELPEAEAERYGAALKAAAF